MANFPTNIQFAYRLLTLINEFTKGINSSTPQAFFSHKTFALLIINVPTNNRPVISFTVNFTRQETRASEQEHQTDNERFFNVELATPSKHVIPTRSITVLVMVPPFELKVNGSQNDRSPIQRLSFSVFIQDKLFMPFNETDKKLSSVIVGIAMNGTHTVSSTEPTVIIFTIPKVKLWLNK